MLEEILRLQSTQTERLEQIMIYESLKRNGIKATLYMYDLNQDRLRELNCNWTDLYNSIGILGLVLFFTLILISLEIVLNLYEGMIGPLIEYIIENPFSIFISEPITLAPIEYVDHYFIRGYNKLYILRDQNVQLLGLKRYNVRLQYNHNGVEIDKECIFSSKEILEKIKFYLKNRSYNYSRPLDWHEGKALLEVVKGPELEDFPLKGETFAVSLEKWERLLEKTDTPMLLSSRHFMTVGDFDPRGVFYTITDRRINIRFLDEYDKYIENKLLHESILSMVENQMRLLEGVYTLEDQKNFFSNMGFKNYISTKEVPVIKEIEGKFIEVIPESKKFDITKEMVEDISKFKPQNIMGDYIYPVMFEGKLIPYYNKITGKCMDFKTKRTDYIIDLLNLKAEKSHHMDMVSSNLDHIVDCYIRYKNFMTYTGKKSIEYMNMQLLEMQKQKEKAMELQIKQRFLDLKDRDSEVTFEFYKLMKSRFVNKGIEIKPEQVEVINTINIIKDTNIETAVVSHVVNNFDVYSSFSEVLITFG